MSMRKKHEEKLLEVDASMQGNLNFKDPVNLRINGNFEGTLETKGTLTIGSLATVKADIVGENVTVEGKIKGKIIAKQVLALLSTAVIEGEIHPGKLVMEEGAVFDGKCFMLHDFFTIDELARYLEVDLSSITEWANSGKVPAVREGDTWRFERKHIDAWIASGKLNSRI